MDALARANKAIRAACVRGLDDVLAEYMRMRDDARGELFPREARSKMEAIRNQARRARITKMKLKRQVVIH